MKHTKLISVLVALTLLLALALPAAADWPAKTGELAADYTGKTVVLHTNDVHGEVDRYAAVAWLKQELQGRGAQVLLADAGDFAQGSIYVNSDDGMTAVALMNAAGYDVAAPGNHDFDFGQAALAEIVAAAQFPVICATILRRGETLLPPTWIWESDGLCIGFLGIETPEMMTKTAPSLTEGLQFLSGEALTDCVTVQAAALREAGADLVIALAHLGVHSESAPYRSEDLYAQTQGVDFFIDGHSHNTLTAGSRGEPIQSTGTKLSHVGVIVVDNATKRIEDNFLLPVEGLGTDETVHATAEAAKAAVDWMYETVIGESLVDLTGERSANRGGETNTGNFVCDAIRSYVLRDAAFLQVDADHLVAMLNGGSIRDSIRAGTVTRRTVNNAFPFDNSVCVVYVTGAELLELLETTSFSAPELSGGFPQTSGIRWTLDSTKPYDRGETFPGSTFHAPNSIRRVSIQSVNGQPFDPAARYGVAVNNFMAEGGDSYYLLRDKEQYDTGMLVEQILSDYVRQELGGVIGADYAAARGDLTVLTLANSVCVPAAQTVNGTAVEAYDINGATYVKLRDAAMALSGGDAQFEVRYDAEQNAVIMETGKAYTPVGGELQPGPDRSAGLAVSEQSFLVDGEAVNLVAYVLAGHNYCRLSDLAALLGFEAAPYAAAA